MRFTVVENFSEGFGSKYSLSKYQTSKYSGTKGMPRAKKLYKWHDRAIRAAHRHGGYASGTGLPHSVAGRTARHVSKLKHGDQKKADRYRRFDTHLKNAQASRQMAKKHKGTSSKTAARINLRMARGARQDEAADKKQRLATWKKQYSKHAAAQYRSGSSARRMSNLDHDVIAMYRAGSKKYDKKGTMHPENKKHIRSLVKSAGKWRHTSQQKGFKLP